MGRTTKPDKYPTLAEHYRKKYPSQVAILENSPLQKARPHGINEYDIVGMCRQLDQFRGLCRMMEARGSMSNLDQLPKIGLGVIAANFGISPLPLIAGVQPIPDEIGIVWFEDFIASNTRGNVTAGQSLISSSAGPDVYPVDYGSDTSVDYEFITTDATSYPNVSLTGAAFLDRPIDPQRCKISGSAKFNGDADVVVFDEMIVNPDSGVFANTQKVNGTKYTVYGVVNFTNGTATVELSALPSSDASFTFHGAVETEAADDIVGGQLTWQSKPVQARFFAMKSTFGLFQQYMANRRWGLDIQDEMTKKLTQALNNEIMNIVIKKLLALVPSNAKREFVRQPGSGIDYISHKLAIPDFLTDTSKLITQNAQRGRANVWMAGLNAAAVLEALPGFTRTFNDDTFGPHVFGTYRGATVIRVPSSLLMDPDLIIGIYKGESPFEAPVVWAPLMPLTMTEVLIAGTNPLQYQKAGAMSGAIEPMIPNFLCQAKIDQTGFDYNSL